MKRRRFTIRLRVEVQSLSLCDSVQLLKELLVHEDVRIVKTEWEGTEETPISKEYIRRPALGETDA